ncbi:MAG: AraC family transcriptional regulator [Clostridia bacterium]|nr:AraC family transcriptional regulator [Clostridia bacterium]
MQVKELAEKLNAEILTGEINLDRDVKNGYVGDLLSWVMSKAQQDDAWVTIMSNTNIVAVAVLTDVACIVLSEGVDPEPATLEKAVQQEVAILKTSLSSFEAACAIKELL